MIGTAESPHDHEGVVRPPLHFEKNGGNKDKTLKIEDDKERQQQREIRRKEKQDNHRDTGQSPTDPGPPSTS